MRAHLADCTDCRVVQQRTARLQRLLALKTHEQPGARYFEGVVGDFHRRLAAESQPVPLVDQWLQWLGLDSLLSPRYGWASACAVLLVIGLGWVGLRNTVSLVEHNQASSRSVAWIEPGSLPVPAVPVVPAALTDPEPVAEQISVGFVPSTAPRYVLDQIGITPASYESPHVGF